MTDKTTSPKIEHSVPWFWPMAAWMEMEDAGFKALEDSLRYIGEAVAITRPPEPKWATKNDIVLDLDTMRLRDFGGSGTGLPVIVDAPFAGHSSTIADYDVGQSLVETLVGCGLGRVLCTDWKTATPEMRDFDIDKYLAEINVAVDDLGGKVILVGLCQGGWMSAMYAARFPEKVAGLVLAGSPIDTDAGDGPIRNMAHEIPLSVYEDMVKAGKGRMLGQFMLTGWKNMHPDKQYLNKFIDLYTHIEDEDYLERSETFESWYERPLDLPGRYYLQAIELLFKKNLFAKGEFIGLGRKLDLGAITCPAFLLAGESDDITTQEQVFAARGLLGTPDAQITQKLVPGGHIGLFMGRRTLTDTWPGIAEWIAATGGR
ncbi:alpha/beta fold hydrolase [Pseudooceanicola sp. CBS1P-1]|uniref:Alpha/beta fold hydrolase n=1 Tax=Pseudooceanicola albus TaxID=2692189 RepID=A0A6L7G205_9RHOB|nr:MULTISPECIES: alpha/beta fold hydrolase [Pseudooceanicola]MBT9383615.1 alpha/beta fold hydrolase [Pseudooceanicola endophyticus]MXN17470.1 alpha/beta fold hydrolase [Pseudooceanicola albus]